MEPIYDHTWVTGKMFCKNCHMTNHNVENCFKIYGYPPGANKKNNYEHGGRGGRGGKSGRGRGRFGDDRYMHERVQESSSAMVMGEPSTGSFKGNINVSNGQVTISSDQLHSLLAMAEKFKNESLPKAIAATPTDPISNCAGKLKSIDEIFEEDWQSE
ncbi:unnamed protein product [Cuscuta epithymum]|uniref:Uncharacterized protein n=1 Tax=Cuscuta epithymum TaxID=186058 RepID=A0AAV0EDG3_9ASTE|nr:unnamed protein product [Cuscuta epithymum]